MKILFYSLNYAPELAGIGKYSGELAEWLAGKGHEVRVVCAPPYYPEWRLGSRYKSGRYYRGKRNGVEVFRCPLYVPRKPSTLTRLLHLLSFAMSSFPVMIKQWAWKPDVIIGIEPTFFCAPTTLLLSKLAGSKSLLHIQDFELDAMLGLGLAKHSHLTGLCYAVEGFFMRRYAAISSISKAMLSKAGAKTRKLVPVHFFPNWVDTDFVKPDVDARLFRKRWGIPADAQVVLYSGNLGKKQGLDMLLEAAGLMEKDKNVVFLILGDGVEREELIAQGDKLKLTNVRFQSLQPYRDLPALMAMADVHLVLQKKGVAEFMLPSKLTTILSAGGHALITADEGTELGKLCANFPGIAERVDPENVEKFVASLRKMLIAARMGRPKVNEVARQYAVEQLNKQNVLQDFEILLMGLAEDGIARPAVEF